MIVRGLTFAIAVAMLTAACTSTARNATPMAPQGSTQVTASLDEQRSDAGAVALVASWLATGVPTVRVTMDTHSVDLDGFDLKVLARVRLDGGPWVAPSAWEAPKGGHHREGTLTFGALDRASLDAATIVEIEVRDVAVPSRVLRWERER